MEGWKSMDGWMEGRVWIDGCMDVWMYDWLDM